MSGELAKGFLEQIVADPDADTPRLVLADYLDEHGQPERAEFIRVQCDRAKLPPWDAAQVRLRLREKALLDRHGEGWLAELPAVDGARWEGFRRGVVAEVSFASYEALRDNAHRCRAVAPVEAVTVRWPRRREAPADAPPIAELRELTVTGRPADDTEVRRLAGSPQLAALHTLTARGLWAHTLGLLVASPHLSRLRALRLPGNDLGNAGITTLIGTAAFAALEELDLAGRGVSERYNEDPQVSRPGMDALAGWKGLGSVRTLNLSGNDLARAGLRALVRSPHAVGLKHLTLRNTRIDGPAMAEFAEASPARPALFDTGPDEFRLDALDVGENVLKDLGAEYVALAKCLSELKVLRLDRCEVTEAGARLFAKKAKCLPGLRGLDVGHNHFGEPGVRALLDRQPPHLHTLRVRDNGLGDDGAAALAGSPAAAVLHELDLSRNGLGPEAAEALGGSAHLRRLLVLHLADNGLPPPAAAALRASPLGRQLGELVLDEPPGPDDTDYDENRDYQDPRLYDRDYDGDYDFTPPSPPPPPGVP